MTCTVTLIFFLNHHCILCENPGAAFALAKKKEKKKKKHFAFTHLTHFLNRLQAKTKTKHTKDVASPLITYIISFDLLRRPILLKPKQEGIPDVI